MERGVKARSPVRLGMLRALAAGAPGVGFAPAFGLVDC